MRKGPQVSFCSVFLNLFVWNIIQLFYFLWLNIRKITTIILYYISDTTVMIYFAHVSAVAKKKYHFFLFCNFVGGLMFFLDYPYTQNPTTKFSWFTFGWVVASSNSKISFLWFVTLELSSLSSKMASLPLAEGPSNSHLSVLCLKHGLALDFRQFLQAFISHTQQPPKDSGSGAMRTSWKPILALFYWSFFYWPAAKPSRSI